jgi:hypothetical protein
MDQQKAISSSWMGKKAWPDMVKPNTEKINQEVEYCTRRVLGVMRRLAVVDDEEAWFNYASSIVYLSACNARLCWEEKTLKLAAEPVLQATAALTEVWRDRVAVRPAIDVAEGVRGMEILPDSRVPLPPKLVAAARACPDLPEWTNRAEQRNSVKRWNDLTLVVTLQWIIHPDPHSVMRFAIEEALRTMPKVATQVVQLRPKDNKRFTLTAATEYRVYYVTHIVLVLSEFGSRPIKV